METLQQIAVRAFRGRQIEKTPKHLVLVSDMIQKSAFLDQYREVPSFDLFRTRPAYVHARPTLEAVRVTILYLRRRGAERIQGKAHEEFWRKFLEDAGATVGRVVSISG
jgi:hypothetical protein